MTSKLSRRIAATTALGAAAALLLSACGSTSTGSSSSSLASAAADVSTSVAASAGGSSAAGSTAAGAGAAVTVTITDAGGCQLSPDTVAAGQVTFTIKNQDATGVTEAELLSDERIIGERENLTPGFSSSFSVRIDGGSYQFYCPGAATEKTPFTVTGKAAVETGNTADLLQQAAVEYAGYVDDQVSFLLPAVEQLDKDIDAKNLAAAKLDYAKARPFYERIEPVAESFPDLDSAIDLRIGDVESGQKWTGFHPIEQGLFAKNSLTGLAPLADQLVKDVQSLQVETNTLSKATSAKTGKGYQPFEIANGSSGLLDEVLKSKITGEEETYSKLDLLDFAANVEGSDQAFLMLVPALNQIDASVVPSITTQFDALTKTLDTYKDPSALGGWTPYTKLTDADKKKLTDALLAVQEPLANVSSKITQ